MMAGSRPAQASRGFRVIDGLIAIAVTAIGLAWAMAGWSQTLRSIPAWSWTRKPNPYFWFGGDPLYSSVRSLMVTAIYVGTTLAAPWGVALLILRRVRHPLTPFWRARRPGALACLASTVCLGLILIWQTISPSWEDLHLLIGPPSEIRTIASFPLHDRNPEIPWRMNPDPFLHTAIQMPRLAGFVVAGAWIALVLAGRWRAERSWIDRLGRGIGVFWILAAIHFLFLPL
jgi:hypothetical protein